MKIWDTAGQERFRTITYSFYRQADGVIVAFDITNKQSFINVKAWIDSINEHADPSIFKVLVGNKLDLEDRRAVPIEEGEQLARKHDMPYLETSARENINVAELMDFITSTIYKDVYGEESKDLDGGKGGSTSITRHSQLSHKPSSGKGCCA